MSYEFMIWDLDDDEEGNVRHIEEHGLIKEDVEEVLNNPYGVGISLSTGKPIAFGYTPSGEHIAVIFEEIDPDSVKPITAYRTAEPK